MARPDVSATRKPQILAAAAQVLRDRGLGAGRMEEIAQTAGLSVGALYWYFPSKDDLAAALLEHLLAAEQAAWTLAENNGLNASEQLRRRVAARVDAAQAIGALFWELRSHALRTPALRPRVEQHAADQRSAVDALIRGGAARGELTAADLDTAVTAVNLLLDGVWGQIDGATSPAALLRQVNAALELVVTPSVAGALSAPAPRHTWKGVR
jgi:AcrR family transcriptional regulator